MAQLFDSFRHGSLEVFPEDVRGPDHPCHWIKLKSNAANSGTIWVGNLSVTIPGTATDDTNDGWPLEPGEETSWIPLSNLNVIHFTGEVLQDRLHYWLMG